MKLMTSRTGRLGLSLVGVFALVGVAATPAFAAPHTGANASAYGASVHKVIGIVTIPPTPVSTFPSGGSTSSVPLNLGALGNLGVLTASTSGNDGTGTSAALGRVANVALLKTGALPAISADAVQATCTGTAPGAPTGASTIVNGKLGGTTLINVTPAPNTTLLNVPGLVRITLNQQTLTGGVLTVDAIHITLGPGASLGDIVLGNAVCGPNVAVVDAFSFASTPIILGGVAVLLLVAFGARIGYRRLRLRPQV